MSRCFSRPSLGTSVVMGLLLLLTACETPTPPKKQPAPTAASTQAYVQNLTLAHLAADRNPDDATVVAPYAAGLNKYALKSTKPTPLTAVVLGYKTRDNGKSRNLMVPVASSRATDLSGLRTVTQKLAAGRPEYRSVQVRTVTLTTRESVPYSKAQPGETLSKMEDLYQTVNESAQTPARLDAARVQIALTRFFMQAGIRDAAYVSLESTKELLAGVDTSRQADANSVQGLSKQLEDLEDELHKKLPYTF